VTKVLGSEHLGVASRMEFFCRRTAALSLIWREGGASSLQGLCCRTLSLHLLFFFEKNRLRTMAELDIDRLYERLGNLHNHFAKHRCAHWLRVIDFLVMTVRWTHSKTLFLFNSSILIGLAQFGEMLPACVCFVES
jgi:hypothetical protein